MSRKIFSDLQKKMIEHHLFDAQGRCRSRCLDVETIEDRVSGFEAYIKRGGRGGRPVPDRLLVGLKIRVQYESARQRFRKHAPPMQTVVYMERAKTGWIIIRAAREHVKHLQWGSHVEVLGMGQDLAFAIARTFFQH